MQILRSLVLALTIGFAVPVEAVETRKPLMPVESTDAYELLELEATIRKVPPESFDLLRSVIHDATDAARLARPSPISRGDALIVFDAIQAVLAHNNFLQPTLHADWPLTLGIALTPLSLTPQKLASELASPDNAKRVQFLQESKPYYFVDCDAGVQIFLAVAERLGWDFHQVDVPHHSFVRWHLKSGETVNWDWIHGESLPDDYYGLNSDLGRNLQLRGTYLRSYSRKESNAYYRGLIGSEATDKAVGIRLLEQALAEAPQISMTQNNLAWAYAIVPGTGRDKLDLALANAFAALSATPEDGNRIDTLACLLGARGDARELAVALEGYAITHPGFSDPAGFATNRTHLEKSESCK